MKTPNYDKWLAGHVEGGWCATVMLIDQALKALVADIADHEARLSRPESCPACGSAYLDSRGNCGECLGRKGDANVDHEVTRPPASPQDAHPAPAACHGVAKCSWCGTRCEPTQCPNCGRTHFTWETLATHTDCSAPRTPLERIENFRATTGAISGGIDHPERCKCQDLPDNYPGTPHQHYREPPYQCARCSCKGYDPAVPEPRGHAEGRESMEALRFTSMRIEQQLEIESEENAKYRKLNADSAKRIAELEELAKVLSRAYCHVLAKLNEEGASHRRTMAQLKDTQLLAHERAVKLATAAQVEPLTVEECQRVVMLWTNSHVGNNAHAALAQMAAEAQRKKIAAQGKA